MKLTSCLLKSARICEAEKCIPFREARPLILSNEVSTKGQKKLDVSCLQEMAIMFACLKKNEFEESKCKGEITSYVTCSNAHTESKKAKRLRDQSLVVPEGKDRRKFTPRQINLVLKRHPQFNN